MVTKRQLKRLKVKIIEKISPTEVDPAEIDEVEIYFINDDGSLMTSEGENISEKEYKSRLEEERKAGEEVIEITC